MTTYESNKSLKSGNVYYDVTKTARRIKMCKYTNENILSKDVHFNNSVFHIRKYYRRI